MKDAITQLGSKQVVGSKKTKCNVGVICMKKQISPSMKQRVTT